MWSRASSGRRVERFKTGECLVCCAQIHVRAQRASRRAPCYEPAPAPAGCSALFFFHTSMRSRSCTVHIVKSSLSSARSTSFVGGASIVKQFGRMPTTPPVSVSTATMSASGIIIDGFVMICFAFFEAITLCTDSSSVCNFERRRVNP